MPVEVTVEVPVETIITRDVVKVECPTLRDPESVKEFYELIKDAYYNKPTRDYGDIAHDCDNRAREVQDYALERGIKVNVQIMSKAQYWRVFGLTWSTDYMMHSLNSAIIDNQVWYADGLWLKCDGHVDVEEQRG